MSYDATQASSGVTTEVRFKGTIADEFERLVESVRELNGTQAGDNACADLDYFVHNNRDLIARALRLAEIVESPSFTFLTDLRNVHNVAALMLVNHEQG